MVELHKSLFISNFSMKRYLITVCIFIVPIICVAVGVELWMRYSPNDYNYKSKYMKNHATDIECLILGNSHSAWGIDPNCFSFNTFNLAYAGQPLTYDEKLLRKYINELPKLRTLIMSISYVVPYCDYEHGKEKWRAKTYPIYFNIKPDFDNWKYHFEITANSPRVILSRLQQLCNESELHCKVRGNYYATCLSSDEVLKKSRAAEGHNALYYRKDSLPIIYEKNINALKSIIEMCKDKDVQCFFVVPPHTQCYIQSLDNNMKLSTVSLLTSIETNNSNVHFLNFGNDRRFLSNDLFSDADHLCKSGSELFSKILNDTIIDIYKKNSHIPL